jgi:hypothetical protein
MVSQIHTLRNRLAAARLTAAAMLDGKLPPNPGNLRTLAQTLDEVNAIVASVPKYDLDGGAGDDPIVDVYDVIESVVEEFAMIASAVDVALVATKSPTGCRVLRGRPGAMSQALEDELQPLIMALPRGSTIAIAPTAADALRLTVSVPGREPDNRSVRMPGKPVCSLTGSGSTPSGCADDR